MITNVLLAMFGNKLIQVNEAIQDKTHTLDIKLYPSLIHDIIKLHHMESYYNFRLSIYSEIWIGLTNLVPSVHQFLMAPEIIKIQDVTPRRSTVLFTAFLIG